MAEILEQLHLWIEGVIRSLGYPGIAFLMLLENLFPPIPSELVLPFAGFLVADEELSFAGVLAASTVGALAGALVIYAVGAAIDERRARALFRNYGKYLLLSEEDFEQAMRLFRDYGRKMIPVAHLLPGIRSLVSVPPGLQRMNLLVFSLLTAFGILIWNTTLTVAGFWLGQNWERVLDWVSSYEYVVWGVLGVLMLLFVVRRWRRV